MIELRDDAQQLRALEIGGVFVPGCRLPLNAECELVVRGANDELRLTARVVFLDKPRGAGLELVGFGAAMKEQLAALGVAEVAAAAAAALELEQDAASPDAPDDAAAGDAADAAMELDLDAFDDEPPGPDPDADTTDDDDDDDEPAFVTETRIREDDEAAAAPGPAGGDEELGLEAGADAGQRQVARNVHERMRQLPLAQQIKKAHSGELQERVILERMYGKSVWEALLRNPRLTAPEVARIARMGQLPRPLMEIIVGNGAWVQIPEVRRALLANPRLGVDQILRLLRLLPKHELKLAAIQTAYPHAVRDQARRLIKELL